MEVHSQGILWWSILGTVSLHVHYWSMVGSWGDNPSPRSLVCAYGLKYLQAEHGTTWKCPSVMSQCKPSRCKHSADNVQKTFCRYGVAFCSLGSSKFKVQGLRGLKIRFLKPNVTFPHRLHECWLFHPSQESCTPFLSEPLYAAHWISRNPLPPPRAKEPSLERTGILPATQSSQAENHQSWKSPLQRWKDGGKKRMLSSRQLHCRSKLSILRTWTLIARISYLIIRQQEDHFIHFLYQKVLMGLLVISFAIKDCKHLQLYWMITDLVQSSHNCFWESHEISPMLQSCTSVDLKYQESLV